MYSQCPECLTRFRVTADALRAAEGTVRCGRCGIAFNALARLSDEVPPREAATPPPAEIELDATEAPPNFEGPAQTDYQFSMDDIEKVFVAARAWNGRHGVSNDAAVTRVAGVGDEPPVIVVEDVDDFEDITLETAVGEVTIDAAGAALPESDTDATDEFRGFAGVAITDNAAPDDDGATAPENSAPRSLETEAEQETTPLEVHVPGPSAVSEETAGDPEDSEEGNGPANGIAAETGSLEQREYAAGGPDISSALGVVAGSPVEQAPQGLRKAWLVGSLLLVLALIAQWVHYDRQELVRHPLVGPVLNKVYEGVGLTLSPNWDVSAFELRQWGTSGVPDQNGRISVRASISNRAAFAQPYPLLRLELEDRFGESVATREFEPEEYLGDPAQAHRLLDAGDSIEADLLVADPGAEAVGYRLEVCFRESDTSLRCSQGPG